MLIDVTFWESMPQTFIGMRAGISFALIIVIVAEMFIGSVDGLGQRVINSQMIFDMPEMYASIFAAGALGYCLNPLFLTIERKFRALGAGNRPRGTTRVVSVIPRKWETSA